MKPSIFIAVNYKSKFKKKVANIYWKTLSSSCQNLNYFIHSLIYKSFYDIDQFLNLKINQKDHNFIIFLDDPELSLQQIKLLKEKIFVLMHYEDIPEHYNNFYKYSQFLFDGLIVEAEYMNLFEVYGTPTYRTQHFHEIANILDKKHTYDSLIPLEERLFDFSFVGRLDRPNRLNLINQLKERFSNIFIHDSSKSLIPENELKEIIRNTRYLLNSTSIPEKDSYSFKIFPEYKQLQRKSRVFEYAYNGCIIFSEILSERKFSTTSYQFIPVKEIPRGYHVGDFCFEYINEKSTNILQLSKETNMAVADVYNSNLLNNSLSEILDDLVIGNPKFIKPRLSEKDIDKIYTNYLTYKIYKKLMIYFKSDISWVKKIINFTEFLSIQIYKIKVFTIIKAYLKIVLIFIIKYFFEVKRRLF